MRRYHPVFYINKYGVTEQNEQKWVAPGAEAFVPNQLHTVERIIIVEQTNHSPATAAGMNNIFTTVRTVHRRFL